MSCIVVTGSIYSGWRAICDLLDASSVPRLNDEHNGEPVAGRQPIAGCGPEDLDTVWTPSISGDFGYQAVEHLAEQFESFQELPERAFAIVGCCNPEQALRAHLTHGTAAPTPESVRAFLDRLQAQLRNMLGFVYRYRSQCLLVDTASCRYDPPRFRAAIQRRFGLTLESAPSTGAQPAANGDPHIFLGTLIAADMIVDDTNLDEVYSEVEGACDVIDAGPAMGAGIRHRREQLLAQSVTQFRALQARLSREDEDLQDTRSQLELAMVQIADLHRELEERYEDIEGYRSKLAMMAHSGHLHTLSLVRRARAPQNA